MSTTYFSGCLPKMIKISRLKPTEHNSRISTGCDCLHQFKYKVILEEIPIFMLFNTMFLMSITCFLFLQQIAWLSTMDGSIDQC